jgi:hypothetical protein
MYLHEEFIPRIDCYLHCLLGYERTGKYFMPSWLWEVGISLCLTLGIYAQSKACATNPLMAYASFLRNTVADGL